MGVGFWPDLPVKQIVNVAQIRVSSALQSSRSD
jgi:hypothetical protein